MGLQLGVPSPDGNPIIKQVYGRGTVPQKVFDPLGASVDPSIYNQRLVPIAPFSTVRIRVKINLAGVLNIYLADGGRVEVGPRVAASEVLTVVLNPANGETVTIDSKVYTYQTVLTDVDGNVFIGATAAISLLNLIAAITLGVGSGTTYADSMTLHPTSRAVSTTATTMTATAKSGGTSGNSIATTETLLGAGNLWGGATMSGGVMGELTGDETALVADTEVVVDLSAAEHVGEPWLIVEVAGLTGPANVSVFDVSGSSF